MDSNKPWRRSKVDPALILDDFLVKKGGHTTLEESNIIPLEYTLEKTKSFQDYFKERASARGEIYMTKGRKTTQEERSKIVAFCIEHK